MHSNGLLNRRVFVTGGAGYIGSHTCKALATAGYEPITFDNLSTGHRWAVKWGPLIVGDLADPTSLRDALVSYRPAAVIHFAASAYVGESVTNPRKYFRNNVQNSLHLLDALLDVGVNTIVLSSTCATYGVPKIVPIPESHPQRPVNPYGESKLFIERALRWYGEAYGLRSLALRYFNAAGADPGGELGEDHDPETHLIPLAVAAALGDQPPLQVFGTDYQTMDGTCVRDYVHVSDLAAAHVSALVATRKANPGHASALNLGTGSGQSVLQVLDTVRILTGHPVPHEFAPRRPGDPPVLVAQSSARTVLQWTPSRSSLLNIVESTCRWQRQHTHHVHSGQPTEGIPSEASPAC